MPSWSLSRERVDRYAFRAVLIALLLSFGVTTLQALWHGWPNPGGDNALIELRIRDVGGHTPLLGSYGRYGFNQPGPLWFYLLAVPYRLLGSRYGGLQVGTLILGAAAAVSIVVICRRGGGLFPVLWSAVVVGLLVHGLGPSWVADPWEPHALTLVCAALLLLAFEAATRRFVLLPITAAAATLLAQAQAGLVGFAAAVLAVAVGGVLVRGVGERGGRRFATPALWALVATVLVLAVLWTPPLIALASHDQGNLAAMWRSLRSPIATLGNEDAWRSVALQLGPRGPWLGFREPILLLGGTLDVRHAPLVPIGLLALVATSAVALRRRDEAAVFGGVVVVAIVAAVASLGRLVGPLFFWIPEWTRCLGMACWLAVGWCVYQSCSERLRGGVDRVAVPLLLLGIAAISMMNLADAVRYHPPNDPLGSAIHRLADHVVPAARSANGAVLVSASTAADPRWAPGLPTLVLDLERGNIDTVVGSSLADRFGTHRAQPQRAAIELRLTTADEAIPAGFQVAATTDPLTPSQRADRERLLSQIASPGSELSLGQLAQLFSAHPELRPLVRQLNAIPDLPVLRLVVRRLP